MATTYQGYLNQYNKRLSRFSNRFSNPYTYNLGRPSKDVINTMAQNMMYRPPYKEPEIPQKRSFLDRSLDALMTPVYTIMGTVEGAINPEKTALEGFVGGLKAGNPFGKGNPEGEITFSDVMTTMGWRPTSVGGKVLKGTLGFVGDVVFDPTTYLTGGVSALAKGTGRVGKAKEALSKVADDLPYMRFDNKYNELIKQGVAKDEAERIAMKEMDALLANPKELTHMDLDTAKEIVKHRSLYSDKPLKGAELEAGAQQLMDTFNRMIGIRDIEPGFITWGIGNLPLMPKKYRDKVITLGSDKAVREFSDRMKISSAYAGIRNFLYGSKIGKLLSTKSPLYEFAHNSPEKLWEVIEFNIRRVGQHSDKIKADREVREFVSSMNLTPAQNKEVLRLLEDKKILHTARELVKLKDLELTKKIRSELKNKKAESQKNLESLLIDQELAEINMMATSDALKGERSHLDYLRNKYQEDLKALEVENMQSIKSLEDQLGQYKKELEHLGQDVLKMDGREAVIKLHDELKSQRTRRQQEIQEGAESALDMVDKVTPMTALRDVQDALSAYVYGRVGAFRKLSQHHLDEVVEQVRKGATPRQVHYYIDENWRKFSPQMRQVYQQVARSLNYKDWYKDGYLYPLARILGEDVKPLKSLDFDARVKKMDEYAQRIIKMAHEGKLTEEQINAFARLRRKDSARRAMLAHYGRMTPEELNHVIRNDIIAKHVNDFWKTEDELIDLRRQMFTDDDFARGVRSEDRAGVYHARGATGSSEYEVVRLKPHQYDEVIEDMLNFGIFKRDEIEKNMTDTLSNFMRRVVKEADDVASKEYNKSYLDLTDKQKELVLKHAKANIEGKPETFMITPERRKRIEEAAQQRIREKAEEEIVNSVTKGSELTFQGGNRVRVGEVQEIKTSSSGDVSFVVKARDELFEVKPSEVLGFKQNIQKMTPQEIYARSHIAQDDVVRKQELLDEIKRIEDAIKQSKSHFDSEKLRLTNFFKNQITQQREKIFELEQAYKNYRDIKDGKLTPDIERLEREIRETENLLVNDDALETYIRANEAVYGSLDEAIDNFARSTGKVWLDEMTHDEKVKETVRSLRAKFIEMGQKEVEIGRLGEKQFKAMIDNYLPHILSPDGAEFVRKSRELVMTNETRTVTQDFGFGVRYNPHSEARQLKGTVEEINAQFADLLKGRNLLAEDVADIYLTRALKHNEVMYDDAYMKTMLDIFGKEAPPNGVVEEGYKLVTNYGVLKQNIADMASMSLSMRISREVSSYLREKAKAIRLEAREKGRPVNEIFNEHAEWYVKSYFNDARIERLYQEYHEQAIKSTGLPMQILDDQALPMVEMTPKQMQNLQREFDDIYKNFRSHLMDQSKKALMRNDMARVEEYARQFDALTNKMRPNVKQVNEVIVNKANQARMLQRTKDQRRWLLMYDKVLNFFKVNQTIVAPYFHARNKLSNMYQNWLNIGREAFNLNNQIAVSKLSRIQGNRVELQRLIDKSPYWAKKFEPITLTNPHPSVVEAGIVKDGNKIDWAELYDMALAHGVIDTGVFARDIPTTGMARGVMPWARIRRKDGTHINLDPTDVQNNSLYRLGTEVGKVTEDGDRLIHFIAELKNGKSVQEAARSSREFLFDYSDITAFEAMYMKRIFPYYTWLRKNARLQLSQLIDNPEKFRTVAKVLTGIEHMTPIDERLDPRYMSEWTEGWIQLPFTGLAHPAVYDEYGNMLKPEKRYPVLFSANLPFMDLARLPDPTQIDDSLRGLFSQMSPMIRNPYELTMNYSAFFDSPIAKKDDSKLVKYAEYMANQFAIGNMITGHANKDGFEAHARQVWNNLTGMRITPYNYEASKYHEIERAKEGDGFFDSMVNNVTGGIQGAIQRALGGGNRS